MNALLTRLASRAYQRITDRRRERRIAELKRICAWASDHKDTELLHDAWSVMCEAIAARSPGQIERMERRRGLRR